MNHIQCWIQGTREWTSPPPHSRINEILFFQWSKSAIYPKVSEFNTEHMSVCAISLTFQIMHWQHCWTPRPTWEELKKKSEPRMSLVYINGVFPFTMMDCLPTRTHITCPSWHHPLNPFKSFHERTHSRNNAWNTRKIHLVKRPSLQWHAFLWKQKLR